MKLKGSSFRNFWIFAPVASALSFTVLQVPLAFQASSLNASRCMLPRPCLRPIAGLRMGILPGPAIAKCRSLPFLLGVSCERPPHCCRRSWHCCIIARICSVWVPARDFSFVISSCWQVSYSEPDRYGGGCVKNSIKKGNKSN